MCVALQGAFEQELRRQGTWPAWEEVWAEQRHFTHVHDLAYIPGNTRVMSCEYARSRTRNGTRVQVLFPDSSGIMQPHACEVEQFIELEHSTPAANSRSAAAGNTSAAGLQQGAGAYSELFAIVRRFNTVVRTDQPELAEVMLEAKWDDYAPDLFVIPLSDIVCALNACLVARETEKWLMFVPHQSMSLGHTCRLPATVYNSY